jgi:hypothetical protein
MLGCDFGYDTRDEPTDERIKAVRDQIQDEFKHTVCTALDSDPYDLYVTIRDDYIDYHRVIDNNPVTLYKKKNTLLKFRVEPDECFAVEEVEIQMDYTYPSYPVATVKKESPFDIDVTYTDVADKGDPDFDVAVRVNTPQNVKHQDDLFDGDVEIKYLRAVESGEVYDGRRTNYGIEAPTDGTDDSYGQDLIFFVDSGV